MKKPLFQNGQGLFVLLKEYYHRANKDKNRNSETEIRYLAVGFPVHIRLAKLNHPEKRNENIYRLIPDLKNLQYRKN